MLDQVTGMRVFVRAANLGGFSAASRALGMSQSMATKHVDAIEDRLGVKLLHRSTRRLTLTEAGRQYLDAAERILADLDETEAMVASERVEVRGTLRVNVPVSFGVRKIAPRLASFSARYPELLLDVGLNDRTVHLVEEGWDLAVRIGRLRDSALIARKLAPCPIVVCAAPSYLAAHGTPRTIAELERHNCLGYTLSPDLGTDRWPFGENGEVIVPVRGNLHANNGDALLAAAIAGQGIIYQPEFIVEDALARGAVVPLAFELPTMGNTGIYAVYPGGRRPPAKVRVFIDFLAKELGGRG